MIDCRDLSSESARPRQRVTARGHLLDHPACPLNATADEPGGNVYSFDRLRPWQGGAVPAVPMPSSPRAVRLLLAGLALASLTCACDSALDRPSPTTATVTTTPTT